MKKCKQLLMLIFLCCPFFSTAQVTFNFLPEMQGRTLEGLLMVKMANMETQRKPAYLTITVTEQRSGKIVELRTPQFDLNPGVVSLPPAIMSRSAVQFGSNKLAVVARQTNQFPEGEYEYCFRLFEGGKQNTAGLLAEQCFDYSLQPFSALMLVEPYDADRICDRRPMLRWQPLMPAIPGVMYKLMLTEVKEGQEKTEALHYNLPVINQANIQTPMLLYPPAARQLEEGKKYAWQVVAYRNTVLLASSEVWDFTVKCEDSVESLPVESFRNIEDLAKGNYYIARGSLMFALQNAYEPVKMSYTIECITKPDTKIKRLPEVMLHRGMNQVVIDLRDSKGFTDGSFYILHVKLVNGEEKQLRFIYKETAE